MASIAETQNTSSLLSCSVCLGAVLIGAFTTLVAFDARAQESTTEPVALPGADSKDKDEWSARIGLGAGVAPTYEGSDEYEWVPLPTIAVTWRDRVFFGTEGLGVNVIQNKHIRLGARLTYNRGRDQDDDESLRGLGDVDPTIEAGLFGSYTYKGISLSADLRQDVASGHDGMTLRTALTITRPLAENLTGTFGPSVTWADDNYMQSFFGVTPSQSARSGLAQYDAGSGIKNYGLNAKLTYDVNDSWIVTGIVRYTHLTGDAADSPIVQSDDQIFSGFNIAYRF